MPATVFIARRIDAPYFYAAHPDVFDSPPEPQLTEAYLAAPHLHIAIAVDAGQMVGMCSGVHYHHPDKANQYWINELSVAGPWRRQGIATELITRTCAHARGLGCSEAWVIADPTPEAMGFYQSLHAEQAGTRLAMFTFDLRDAQEGK